MSNSLSDKDIAELKKLSNSLIRAGYAEAGAKIVKMAESSDAAAQRVWKELITDGLEESTVDLDWATPIYYKKSGPWSKEPCDRLAEGSTSSLTIVWSPDKENWMTVGETKVSGGKYNGRSPTSQNVSIIGLLAEMVNQHTYNEENTTECTSETSDESSSGEAAPAQSENNRREERRVGPWVAVQNRLNQLGYVGKNGRKLNPDGLWGPQTLHAWNSATNNADRPSSPDRAFEALKSANRRGESGGQTRTSMSAAMTTTLTRWIKYDGGDLNLSNRDTLVARTNSRRGQPGPGDDAAVRQLLLPTNTGHTTRAYEKDKAVNENLEQALSREPTNDSENNETKDNEQNDTGERKRVDLTGYFHHPDSNIYMRKSDGSIWYLSGNTLRPIQDRGTGRVDDSEGQNRMTFREGRQMRRILNAAVDSGEITDDQKDAYVGMIVGTRKADAIRSGRRRKGRRQLRESRRAIRESRRSRRKE